MEKDENSVGPFTSHDHNLSAFVCKVLGGVEVVDNHHIVYAHVSAKPKQGAPDSIRLAAKEAAGGTEESRHSDQDSEEIQEKPPLSYELQQGFRILRELMADSNKTVNWPFLDRVDDSYPETRDYYERIKNPMWLTRMLEKFEERSYNTITGFVADLRLMLENCYRFNGPDHHISKKGQRLETMLEQKLALLSRELRAKTTVAATSGKKDDDFVSSGLRRRPKAFIPHDSSALLNQLRNEEAQRERELRRQQIADRRAANEAAQKEILDWESNTLLAEPIKTQMMHSWELPQIGLFLYLLREPLNLGEIPQFELERCLAMSRQSATLQFIMTSLLSTPFQRLKIDKKTMMPYSVWTFKLTKKLDVWYKVLNDCHGDKTQAAVKLGLDAYGFDVMGTRNPLRRRPFHKHSFYRKVWILKSLCDYCLETQESLRKFLEESQPIEDQRELVLGHDAKGNIYIHFPQFCGADLRIYRQRKPQPPESSDDEEEDAESDRSKTSSAKRQLKLGTVQSGTPSKDSESESVPSPAPSSTKSRSQSRNSSPMPRETSRRTRQSAARNTPSPHSTSQDSVFGATTSRSKTRKTRNSAEASLLFNIMDLEALSRQRSRRGKAAVVSGMESLDTESSCSNMGEGNSQDGVPALFSSSTPISKDSGKENSGDASESKRQCVGLPVKRELDSTGQEETDDVENPGDNPTHSSHLHNTRTQSAHTKTQRSNGVRHDQTKEASDLRANEVKNIKKEPSGCDQNAFSPDILKPSTLSIQDSSASQSIKQDDSHFDSGPECELSSSLKSSVENSPQPATTSMPGPDSDAKADDSGFLSGVCANASLKDSDDETCADKKDGSSDKIKTSVQAALIDHAAYSAATVECKTSKTRVKEEIVMEESDEEEEEMEPDLEEFEMIVDSVNGLQDLVSQFADPPPPAADTGSFRKGKRQRAWKPPQRKKCEMELHQRLSSMLNELTKWEQKLTQAASRMRTKIRKEFDECREEPEEQEDDTEVWDTEPEADSSEEEENEESQTEEDGEDSEESQSDSAAAKKKNEMFSTPSTASEFAKNDHRDIEDYEMDVSSRGRLRKRRVIPNNIEDQGIKKRKVVKKTDANGTLVTAAHVPNILQKVQPGKQLTYSYTFSPSGLGDSSALLASLTRQGGSGGGVLSVSGSQLLAMTASQGPAATGSATVKGQQSQGLVITPQGFHIVKTSQATSQGSSSASTTSALSSSAKLNSHPEIQKLLSARRPLVVDNRLAPYKTVQLGVAGNAAACAAASVTVAANSAAASLIGGSVTAAGAGQLSKGTGLVVSTGETNSSQPGGTMMLAMVGGKPQLIPTGLIQQLMQAGTLRFQTTTTVAAVVNNSNTLTSQPGGNIIAASKPQVTNLAGATAPFQVVRPGPSPQGVNRVQLGSLVLKPAAPGQVNSPKQVVPPAQIQGIASVVGGAGGVTVSSSAVAATPATIAQATLLGSPGKQQQRYAGNVTVKALLENRAARKSSEEGDSNQSVESTGQSSAPSSPPKVSITPSSSITSSPPAPKAPGTVVSVVPSASLIARGVGMPSVVQLTSQSMLDLAVQTVVTSYHTTLPTADISVPSPITLPSLSPKKNVTSVVMSTKAPIPITTRCESSSSSSMLTKSTTAVAAGTLTAVVHGAGGAKPGMLLMTGVKGLDPNNKVVLQVVPQAEVGSQTIVQGIMLSDGTVISQGALAQTLQVQTAVQTPSQVQSSAPLTAEPQSPSTDMSQAQPSIPHSSDPIPSFQPIRAGKVVTNKATTDMLKSMLAAKAGTSVVSIQQPGLSPTTAAPTSLTGSPEQTSLAVLKGRVAVGPSMPAAALVQQMAAIGGQNPQIVGTQLAGIQQCAAMQVPTPIGQLGKVVTGQMQLQGVPSVLVSQQQLLQQHQQQASSAAGKIVMASVTAQGQLNQQTAQSGTERVMTMTLPPGLQLAAVPGSTALQLVTPAQMNSGSAGGQPVVAALHGGPQTLRQVRLVATPSGTQRLHILTPQQQQALAGKQLTTAALGGQGVVTGQMLSGQSASVTSGNTVGAVMDNAVVQPQMLTGGSQAKQIRPQVQLCFKVQPSGQTLASSALATAGTPGVPQSTLPQSQLVGPRPVLPRPLSHVAPPPASAASISKATPYPTGAPQSKTSPSNRAFAQQQQQVSLSPAASPSFASSASPSTPNSTQSSPQPNSSPAKNGRQQVVQVPGATLMGKTAQVGRLQMTITPDPSTGQLTISPQPAVLISDVNRGQTNDGSAGQAVVSPPQVRVSGNVVRDGQQKQDQTIPQMGATGVKRSVSDGAVQPIPVKMAHIDASASASNLSGPVLASLSQVAKMNAGHVRGNGVAISPMKPGLGSVNSTASLSDSKTPVQAATQADSTPKTAGNGGNVTIAAGAVSPNQAVGTIQPQINVAQLLQKIQQTSTPPVAPVSAKPSSLTQGAEQQQQVVMQQQQQQPVVMMRTVGGQLLTPLNIPVTVNNGTLKVLPKATFQVGHQMVTVLSPSNAMIQNLKSPTPPQILSNDVGVSATKLEQSAPQQQAQEQVQGDAAVKDVESTGEPSNQAVSRSTVASPEGSADQATTHSEGASQVSVGSHIKDTPVLKARLQQPVNSAPVLAPDSMAPAVNGAGKKRLVTTAKAAAASRAPQKSVPSESGDTFAQNGDTTQDAVGTGRGSDNLVEKEQAALSLLTFANQVPMK